MSVRRIEIPRFVAIETTNRCNAKCIFCPNRSLARDRAVMDDALFAKIIEDCKEFHLEKIEPFLQGEPFMDPRIFDRLELIRSALPTTQLSLYSNGAALNARRSDMLREIGLDQLRISLNTTDPELYREVMGLPLDRTLENLRRLAEHNGKPPVAKKLSVRMTVTPQTTQIDKEQFRTLCNELGVRPMFSAMFNYKRDIPASLPVPNYPCLHIDRLDILVDGRTTLCCMDQEGAYGWGSVREHSVLELHNSEAAQRIRQLHRTGKRHACEPCGQCNVFWPSFRRVSLPRRALFVGQWLTFRAHHRPSS